MTDKNRIIEIFSAGCPVCERVVAAVTADACASCDVRVLDMQVPVNQTRADELGVKSVPAVAIDGRLADCCTGSGVDLSVLRAVGLGRPIS